MKVKGLIDENIKKIEEEKEVVTELKKETVTLKEEIGKVSGSIFNIDRTQQEFLEKLNNNIESINQSRAEFDKEIRDFKLQKTNMERNMFERSDTELTKHIERVKTDVNSYNELKREVTAIKDTITRLRSEIEKFTGISKNIKAKDFELEKYAKELSKRDNEKLDLMRKIESLERLIGRERRKKY